MQIQKGTNGAVSNQLTTLEGEGESVLGWKWALSQNFVFLHMSFPTCPRFRNKDFKMAKHSNSLLKFGGDIR
jgi:hypothetical protein